MIGRLFLIVAVLCSSFVIYANSSPDYDYNLVRRVSEPFNPIEFLEVINDEIKKNESAIPTSRS